MARLKIGFIPIEGGSYYKEALEEVTRAEELGFDSVWMEEHHSVTNHYWPSPLTVLAGFATRTSRMMLGTDIIVAAFHHPVRLAEDVAMLDVMSGGRATLGIAIGYKPDEFALYGVDLEKRGARFEEQLAIIKGLWTQERVSFKGAYYTVEGRLEPKPVTRPHPTEAGMSVTNMRTVFVKKERDVPKTLTGIRKGAEALNQQPPTIFVLVDIKRLTARMRAAHQEWERQQARDTKADG